MIVFNGAALETIAPVRIDDIKVSPIQRSVTARQRPVQPGADFVRVTEGSRTVTITFALLTNDANIRARQLESISEWARSDTEGWLRLPSRPGMMLQCICTEFPAPSARQWWENKLRIVFTTYENPYWTDIAEKSAACGTAFTAMGSAPPLMRIERTLSAAASNQSYSDGTNTATFSTIPAGDLVLDLNRQTAAVGNTSIMQYYAFGGSFPIPKVGSQTITGTGTVKWRERWA